MGGTDEQEKVESIHEVMYEVIGESVQEKIESARKSTKAKPVSLGLLTPPGFYLVKKTRS